jgi:hypothetical protein
MSPVRAEVVAEPRAASPSKWWENPWIVALMLFVVLGPLALPMLWRSRRISLFGKIALTTVVVGITVFLVWLVWYFMYKALEPLRDVWKLQRL